MESYKSDLVAIDCDVQTVFSKLSDPEVLKRQLEANLDKLSEEARENLGKVSFGGDSITIESPMGPLKLALTEKVEPNKIAFAATQSPVPFGMAINLRDAGNGSTEAEAELQLELPVFLRAMVGGKLKDGARMFGKVLASLPYADM